jgi:hypothetical protein
MHLSFPPYVPVIMPLLIADIRRELNQQFGAQYREELQRLCSVGMWGPFTKTQHLGRVKY